MEVIRETDVDMFQVEFKKRKKSVCGADAVFKPWRLKGMFKLRDY